MSDIEIRGLRETDAEALTEIYSQPKAYSGTLQFPHPPSHRWAERVASPAPNGHQLVACIDGRPVGHATMYTFPSSRRRHVATLGMAVHDEFHGRGVGRALLDEVLRLADDWYGILRFELEVYVDNEAAFALYRSSGFEVEGTKRAYAFREGKYVDAYVMSRLRLPENTSRVTNPD